jgi:hypothetical protein
MYSMALVHLTYEELGERLGLSPQAARMRARRRKWAVTKGNDERARVAVDESELAGEAERIPERSRARSAYEPEQAAERWRTLAEERGTALAEGTAENRLLREQLERERARADQLAAEAGKLQARAGKAEGEAAVLRDALFDLARRLDTATNELSELRKPWWRRLLG